MPPSRFTYVVVPYFPGPEIAATDPVSKALPLPIMARRGVPLTAQFPPTTEILLSTKSGNRFTDFIYTQSRVILASQRAWDLMKAEGVTDAQVEYLPFVLKDRKGRVRPEKYGFVNPLLKVACFDFDKSDYTPMSDDPTEGFAGISRLQILPEKVPEDVKLFRLAEDPDVNLIRTDLLEKLRGAGMEGLRGIALGELLE
ncbi:imm11 family protein [Corallococcus terminator]